MQKEVWKLLDFWLVFKLYDSKFHQVCKGQDSEILGVASGHWTWLIHLPLLRYLIYIKINAWLKYVSAKNYKIRHKLVKKLNDRDSSLPIFPHSSETEIL